MEHQTIEDIERAAWFARLVLGVFPETNIAPPRVIQETSSEFQVIP